MKILWAPWREAYVEKTGKKFKGCVFCAILKQKRDKEHYIFRRSAHAFAVLNIYPFNGGHSLVIPNRHVDDLSDLSSGELRDLMALLIEVKGLMAKAFRCQGFNVGLNIGDAAGAGIPGHLHLHIVPRWAGDVNFMPVVFGTKVIPTSLQKTYRRLKDAQKSGHRKARK